MSTEESNYGAEGKEGHTAVYSQKADMADFKNEAIDAENAEHNMTVIQAVKQYPMATFWAFVMACTIVCNI